MLNTILQHLESLVSFDTRNPPRLIGSGGIFDYIRAQLPGYRCEVTDHGDGAVSLLAVRGTPRRVFNVHLDTVPSSEAWDTDPLRLRVTQGDRVIDFELRAGSTQHPFGLRELTEFRCPTLSP